ncbi:MAG: DUF1934 domain-containing protein [Clostridia bacterium]|nr:DUF1934 domain-containing protein [Clostridia bacterium]MBQ8513187.1 DUF1934 domain-containing protein [Clostridia bacterium]
MEQKTVLLTLKSKQVIENTELTRADMEDAFDDGEWESDTEEFLDEWEDDEYYDDDDFEDEEDEDDGAVRYPKKLTEELQARFDKLMDVIFRMEDGDEEDEEYYVMTTEAVMSRFSDEDGEVIEVTYEENPTMDDTQTTLRFHSAHPESLVIIRSGGLVNTLICEKGVRHVSYYKPAGLPLPFPIQMTVYTRSFSGGIDFENGGHVELDYMTAMHGLDKQKTDMKLTVVPR